jgi:hypothetical protein
LKKKILSSWILAIFDCRLLCQSCCGVVVHHQACLDVVVVYEDHHGSLAVVVL